MFLKRATVMMNFLLLLILKGLLKVYKLFISPLLGPRCRFFPSCSDYASESLSSHGIIKGFLLTFKRLLKCHPWGREGWDPVPQPSLEKSFKENFFRKL